MKVHFIFAPPSRKPRLSELGEGRIPPLGLLYLASYLRKRLDGIQMKVTDGLIEGREGTFREIERFQPDLIALSFFTPVALATYQFINLVKKKSSHIRVVVGGPHVSALPQEALERSMADVAVIGEGEVTFYELVKLFQESNKAFPPHRLLNIAGIMFRKNGLLHRTPNRRAIEDLDTITFPARDLINLRQYKGWYLNKKVNEGTILFARGCPFNCTFCSSAVWKTAKPWVRFRSPENIVNEIEELIGKYRVEEIYDCSDEFNTSVKHASAICLEMKKRKLNIVWKAAIRAHPLPERLVELMAETGCWYVMLGIETGNDDTLRGIKKHISLEQVENACRLLKRYGIKIQGLFMLYNVWEENGKLQYENTEMVKNTFGYMNYLTKKKLLDYVGWSITIPYPGSELYDIAVKYNLIKHEYVGNWDRWLVGDSYIMQLPGVDHKDQVRMKTMGSITRAKLILRKREFKLKDLDWMVKKSLKLLQNEIKIKF